MRQLSGKFTSKFRIPCNSSKSSNYLFQYIETVYIRDKNKGNFIPVKICNEKSCLERSDIDTCIITTKRKYNLEHGEYELFVDYILSEDIIDLNPHKYVLLQIPKCNRFQSIDSVTKGSFSKIPLQSGEHMFTNINGLGNIKYLNPILPRLDSLHIKFYPYKNKSDNTNKQTFDFEGGEHVLTFAFVQYKQSLKYGTS